MPIINVDEKVDPAAAEEAGLTLTSVIASDNRDAGARQGRGHRNGREIDPRQRRYR